MCTQKGGHGGYFQAAQCEAIDLHFTKIERAYMLHSAPQSWGGKGGFKCAVSEAVNISTKCWTGHRKQAGLYVGLRHTCLAFKKTPPDQNIVTDIYAIKTN